MSQPTTQSVVASNRWTIPVCLGLILLTTFIVYLPSMHGGMVWDDESNITRPELQSLEGLRRIWSDPAATAEAQYYPLVHTAFWLEHQLWGDLYAGYHVVNVFWHSLAVLAVYLTVTKLEIPGALLAAAIFAVHPVMVESVAWISEQKNTLSAVFYLAALRVYLQFDESRRISWYFSALLLFGLALLTKTITVTLPVAILIVTWWKQGRLSWRRDVQPLVPFFAISVAAGLMTVWVEHRYLGAEGPDFAMTFTERFLLAGSAIWFYLGKLVWPRSLVLVYPRWSIDPAEWWQWTFPTGTILVTVILASIKKRSRAPLAGWLFFCGTLFPVIGFINVHLFAYTFVADHFQYLASLGIIVPITAGITSAIAQLPIAARALGITFSVLLVGVLTTISWRQSQLYGDVVALYRATLECNPDCWMIHNNLGVELAALGKRDDAMEHYRRAVQLKPDDAVAHVNLADLLAQAGQGQAAVEQLRTALTIKPNLFQIRDKLIVALVQQNRTSEAIEQLRLKLQFNPNDANTRNNLGMLLARAGQAEAAIHELEEASRLQPDRADFENNLGYVLRSTGRTQDSIKHFQAALRSQPGFVDAQFNLAQSFAEVNRPADAIAAARRAIDTANSSGRKAAAEEVEEWLRHYGKELERSPNAPPIQ